MNTRPWRATLLVLGVTAAALAVAPPARAECIEVDLAVHRSGRPDHHPLGPDYCVTETPWNQTDRVSKDTELTRLPECTPSGVYVEVWYTSP